MSEPVRFEIHLDDPSHLPGREGGVGEASVPLILETGQPVRGEVRVEVLEGVEFREAQVRFRWRTEGKGNPTSGEGGSETLARGGHWDAGETHTFPFALPAPRGPLSYDGKILKVVWALEARLDRSLLRPDVIEGLPVVLHGSPEPEMADLGPVPQEKEKLEAVKRGLGGVWVGVGLVALLAAIVMGALKGWDFQTVERWLVGILLGGGFLLAVKGFWGRLGRGKLGEPTVQLSTTELRRGEEIRFSISIRPDQRTELRTLEAVLECEERVVQGHGQYQSHHRRIVHERRLMLAKNQMVEAHRGLRKKGVLTLPVDAPPSFGAPHNQVVWWLRFQGDIAGWPDWKEPFLLTVWP